MMIGHEIGRGAYTLDDSTILNYLLSLIIIWIWGITARSFYYHIVSFSSSCSVRLLLIRHLQPLTQLRTMSFSIHLFLDATSSLHGAIFSWSKSYCPFIHPFQTSAILSTMPDSMYVFSQHLFQRKRI